MRKDVLDFGVMGAGDWRSPWHSQHRRPGLRFGKKMAFLRAGLMFPASFGNGIYCGRMDSWKTGSLCALPRRMRKDRTGWSWESTEAVAVDRDRGGSCLHAWVIDPSE